MNDPEGSIPEIRNKPKKEIIVRGVPASPGVAIASVHIVKHTKRVRTPKTIAPEQVPHEIQRLEMAWRRSSDELVKVKSLALESPLAVTTILDAQLSLLNDSSLYAEVADIVAKGFSAETGVVQTFDKYKDHFSAVADQIMRERGLDFEHAKLRILSQLQNKVSPIIAAEGHIVIADSLSPAEIMLCHDSDIVAFATQMSGIASHSSILARTLKIPAVIGIKDPGKHIHDGMTAVLDGYSGTLIFNPRPETIAKYQKKQESFVGSRKKISKIAQLPPHTLDGREVKLFANIDSSDDIDQAVAWGAQGVGLVRSEFLIARHGRLPNEDEQFEWYKEMAERCYPLPLTIRAFDLGSDKSFGLVPPEPNPALGMRGIRYLLEHKEILKTQLKAVLRASTLRNVRFLLPMITSVQEIQKVIAVLEKAKASLRKKDVLFDRGLPLGVMVETPGAALISGHLASLVDFFSIGTNDLTQFTLATDRENIGLTDVFDPFHPAVLRLIKIVCDNAKFFGKSVAVCGEMAGHSAATELLVGLGVDELSVVTPSLIELKKRVRKMSYSQSVVLANQVLTLVSSVEVRKRVLATRKS